MAIRRNQSLNWVKLAIKCNLFVIVVINCDHLVNVKQKFKNDPTNRGVVATEWQFNFTLRLKVDAHHNYLQLVSKCKKTPNMVGNQFLLLALLAHYLCYAMWCCLLVLTRYCRGKMLTENIYLLYRLQNQNNKQNKVNSLFVTDNNNNNNNIH